MKVADAFDEAGEPYQAYDDADAYDDDDRYGEGVIGGAGLAGVVNVALPGRKKLVSDG